MGRAAYILFILLFSAGGPVWGFSKFGNVNLMSLSPSFDAENAESGSHQNSKASSELEKEIEENQGKTEERFNRTIELGSQKNKGTDSPSSRAEGTGSSRVSDKDESKQPPPTESETKSLAGLLTIEKLLKEAEGEKAEMLSDLKREKLDEFLAKAPSDTIGTINKLLKDKDIDGDEAKYLRELKKKLTAKAQEKSNGDAKSDLISNLVKNPAKALKNGFSSLTKTASDYFFGEPKGDAKKSSPKPLDADLKTDGEKTAYGWLKDIATPKEGRTWGGWMEDVLGGPNPNESWAGRISKTFGPVGDAVVNYGRATLNVVGPLVFGETGQTAANLANLANDENLSEFRIDLKKKAGFTNPEAGEFQRGGQTYSHWPRERAEVGPGDDFSFLQTDNGGSTQKPPVTAVSAAPPQTTPPAAADEPQNVLLSRALSPVNGPNLPVDSAKSFEPNVTRVADSLPRQENESHRSSSNSLISFRESSGGARSSEDDIGPDFAQAKQKISEESPITTDRGRQETLYLSRISNAPTATTAGETPSGSPEQKRSNLEPSDRTPGGPIVPYSTAIVGVGGPIPTTSATTPDPNTAAQPPTPGTTVAPLLAATPENFRRSNLNAYETKPVPSKETSPLETKTTGLSSMPDTLASNSFTEPVSTAEPSPVASTYSKFEPPKQWNEASQQLESPAGLETAPGLAIETPSTINSKVTAIIKDMVTPDAIALPVIKKEESEKPAEHPIQNENQKRVEYASVYSGGSSSLLDLAARALHPKEPSKETKLSKPANYTNSLAGVPKGMPPINGERRPASGDGFAAILEGRRDI